MKTHHYSVVFVQHVAPHGEHSRCHKQRTGPLHPPGRLMSEALELQMIESLFFSKTITSKGDAPVVATIALGRNYSTHRITERLAPPLRGRP